MKRYLYLFIAALFIFSTVRDGDATMAYTGLMADSDGEAYFVLGGYTEDERFLKVDAEALRYDLDDNGVDRGIRIKQVTIAGGMEFGGPMNLAVTLGPTIWNKEEKKSFGTKDTHDIGITVGVLGHKTLRDAPVDELEFAASFTTLDSFFRGRVRGKTVRYVPYTIGAEAFIMANNDFRSLGAGPFAEFNIDIGILVVRAGLKRSTETDTNVYGGFEFSKHF